MKGKPTTLRPYAFAYSAVNIITGFISTDALSSDQRISRQIIGARFAVRKGRKSIEGGWQEAYKDGWRIHLVELRSIDWVDPQKRRMRR